MTLRTGLILSAFSIYMAIPVGAYDAARDAGAPWWARDLTYSIFLTPVLFLAWWLIDRKRSSRP